MYFHNLSLKLFMVRWSPTPLYSNVSIYGKNNRTEVVGTTCFNLAVALSTVFIFNGQYTCSSHWKFCKVSLWFLALAHCWKLKQHSLFHCDLDVCYLKSPWEKLHICIIVSRRWMNLNPKS